MAWQHQLLLLGNLNIDNYSQHSINCANNAEINKWSETLCTYRLETVFHWLAWLAAYYQGDLDSGITHEVEQPPPPPLPPSTTKMTLIRSLAWHLIGTFLPPGISTIVKTALNLMLISLLNLLQHIQCISLGNRFYSKGTYLFHKQYNLLVSWAGFATHGMEKVDMQVVSK